MLGQLVVLRAGRAAKVVKGQPEPIRDMGLDLMQFGTVIGHRLTCLGGSQFGRGAVFVRGAQKQHLVAAPALIAGKEVGRQLRADEIAKVFDAVDVRQGGGDQVTGHFCAYGLRFLLL